MKKRFLTLLLALLLLCGCSAPSAGAGSTLENPLYTCEEAIHVTSMAQWKPLGFAAMGENLLFLRKDHRDAARLTLVSGKDLSTIASVSLPNFIYPTMELFQVREHSVACYDTVANAVLVFDDQLQQIMKVPLPADIMGNALITEDLSTLYFGTAQGICAMTADGSSRWELFYSNSPYKHMDALLSGDSILRFSLTTDAKAQVLYLFTETGALLYDDRNFNQVQVAGNYYYGFRQEPEQQVLFFGTPDRQPQSIHGEPGSNGTFLPQSHQALFWSFSKLLDRTILQCYDLETGICTARQALDFQFTPWLAAETSNGRTWLLGQGSGQIVLVRWCRELSACKGTESHLAPYYTLAFPDWDGIARCQQKAKDLSDKYGIDIRVWEDVQEITPWDYDLHTEYRVPVLETELELIDQCFSNYPGNMLRILSEDVNGLRLCLVKGIYAKSGLGGIASVAGLQYEENGTYCMALVSRNGSEYTLYHELCHMLDHYVSHRSDAYEDWELLNPPDFQYDYDYLKNQYRDGREYLGEEDRAFIDAYSMSFPDEDRARIMEYAMTPGHEQLFAPPVMQAKLGTLSQGIREAFLLKKPIGSYLWEQYLLP